MKISGTRRLPALMLGLAFFLEVSASHADEASIESEHMQAGSLLLQMESGYVTATRINTEIDIRISGPVARTGVRQVFRNDGAEWVEALYVFPLPETAAVDRMRMQIGERIIEGEVREKKQARAVYEQAKAGGQQAGLVEQQRPNLFTSSLANVAPGETIVIEIAYLETVRYEDGLFSLRVPLTLTPRYIPGTPWQDRQGSGWSPDTDRVPDASLITPPVVTRSEDHTVTMRAEIDAGLPLQIIASRYHPIDVDEANARYTVTLGDAAAPMDHDLELTWRPVGDSVARAALFREPTGGDAHYLLMVLPPDENPEERSVPRELVLLVDTSGSMHGTSIEQAKQALLFALDGLRPDDRFNVIQFNSVTQPLFPSSVAASPANRKRATGYVRNLSANGGTEMRPALELALRASGGDSYLTQVLFITDGSVGNEQELFSLIELSLGETRLFTVGIGSAPNSLFMRKAAEAGRGTFVLISALHEVREKMSRLIRQLERPQVTGIEVAWPGEALAYPGVVPDLYAGEPVVQKARLALSPRAGDLVRVSGTSASGDWSAELPLGGTDVHRGVAAVWARARIEQLLDEERRGADAEEVRAAVIETALGHHLVSRYTSLVAVDRTPLRPQSSPLDREQLPNLLPYGQSTQAIFGFPATASGWSGDVAAGAVMALVAFLLLAGGLNSRSHARARV